MQTLQTLSPETLVFTLLIAAFMLIYNYLQLRQMMQLLTDIKSSLAIITAYYQATQHNLIKC